MVPTLHCSHSHPCNYHPVRMEAKLQGYTGYGMSLPLPYVLVRWNCTNPVATPSQKGAFPPPDLNISLPDTGDCGSGGESTPLGPMSRVPPQAAVHVNMKVLWMQVTQPALVT